MKEYNCEEDDHCIHWWDCEPCCSCGYDGGGEECDCPRHTEVRNKMNEDIENRFTYHTPKPGQPEIYQDIRNLAKTLANLIDELVPNGREKALAFTKLEETVFWANAGVARNG